jgi:antitoxin component of MazEF toxin-antitoxin module
MIAGRIRKAGNSYVVTIPPKEMDKRGLHEGQLVGFDPVPMELRPVAPPRLAPTEEANASEDVPHEQVMREWDERLSSDIAAGIVTRADVEQAREDLEQGAPWAQSL